jgi:hypothetical protein
MKRIVIIKKYGVEVSFCSSGLCVDCFGVGTILVSWEMILAAKQKLIPTITDSNEALRNFPSRDKQANLS